jgi:hypothetical protein
MRAGELCGYHYTYLDHDIGDGFIFTDNVLEKLSLAGLDVSGVKQISDDLDRFEQSVYELR